MSKANPRANLEKGPGLGTESHNTEKNLLRECDASDRNRSKRGWRQTFRATRNSIYEEEEEESEEEAVREELCGPVR